MWLFAPVGSSGVTSTVVPVSARHVLTMPLPAFVSTMLPAMPTSASTPAATSTKSKALERAASACWPRAVASALASSSARATRCRAGVRAEVLPPRMLAALASFPPRRLTAKAAAAAFPLTSSAMRAASRMSSTNVQSVTSSPDASPYFAVPSARPLTAATAHDAARIERKTFPMLFPAPSFISDSKPRALDTPCGAPPPSLACGISLSCALTQRKACDVTDSDSRAPPVVTTAAGGEAFHHRPQGKRAAARLGARSSPKTQVRRCGRALERGRACTHTNKRNVEGGKTNGLTRRGRNNTCSYRR
ncbi:hypothetical protein, conserved in T.vivax [Trypanosoma vivax Y486]|uniref:Uncharacterized protein n=1 Tax=Trypanosoma vivax (strain Y486) TaxID=1055687 RepID=F9WR38_TRYVY|nr:hypothetical protein, conserved in T.vivax [Trypanosoma vivax Y486]|eukprot:CCD20022.1 hypothetical protein, conserved in T.vivax [Trypanosoma vivax Y486]